MTVSDDAAERELLRRGASGASIPVNISEVEAAQDEAAARRRLAEAPHDVVLFDSRMPVAGQHALLDVVVEAGVGEQADQLDDALRALHTAFDLDSSEEATVYGGTGR